MFPQFIDSFIVAQYFGICNNISLKREKAPEIIESFWGILYEYEEVYEKVFLQVL